MKPLSNFAKASVFLLTAISGTLATSRAAVTSYSEFIGGDLSDTFATATTLQSGTWEIIGQLDSVTDRADHFIIDSLLPGSTATFSYTWYSEDTNFPTLFIYDSTVGAVNVLYGTGILNPFSGSATTSPITVPASGKILISWEDVGSAGSGLPITSWTISTNDVIPEPSSAAIVALGSLLVIMRRRAR